MKVGTDGVLLGAWAAVRPADRTALDIGTGTGLIALMLAQRGSALQVTGIDIDDVSQARENADASPWGGRVHFERVPVQTFSPPSRFDLILSNPPFYVDSLTSPDAGRTRARHAASLPFEELRDAVVRLLADDGRFSLILPAEESGRFRQLAAGRLFPQRVTEVQTVPTAPVKRLLVEYALVPCDSVRCDRLVIGTGRHEEYTAEYRALTKDFYLKF